MVVLLKSWEVMDGRNVPQINSINFYEDEGVERQLIVSYTSQQSRVSKRNNQIFMEIAKSMLYEKWLTKVFWLEAVYTTIYLMNKYPIKVMWDKIPFEA